MNITSYVFTDYVNICHYIKAKTWMYDVIVTLSSYEYSMASFNVLYRGFEKLYHKKKSDLEILALQLEYHSLKYQNTQSMASLSNFIVSFDITEFRQFVKLSQSSKTF